MHIFSYNKTCIDLLFSLVLFGCPFPVRYQRSFVEALASWHAIGDGKCFVTLQSVTLLRGLKGPVYQLDIYKSKRLDVAFKIHFVFSPLKFKEGRYQLKYFKNFQ